VKTPHPILKSYEQHQATIQRYLERLPVITLLRIKNTPLQEWVGGSFCRENGGICKRCLVGVTEDWRRTRYSYHAADRAVINLKLDRPVYAFDWLYANWGRDNVVEFLQRETNALLDRWEEQHPIDSEDD